MSHAYPLRISTPHEEGIMQVSKSLTFQVLLDDTEMESLLYSLGSFQIFIVSQPVGSDHGLLEKDQFIQAYRSYSSSLKNGVLPEEKAIRPVFSSVWTKEDTTLYALGVGEEKFLIKALKPIIQLQLHHLSHSKVDGKFHAMVQGKESITWGLQFSYPQIFQHPKTKEYSKVGNTPDFPNTPLFLALSRFLRQNTLPTPMIVDGRRMNLSVRLGKACFPWINSHPRLSENAFQVYTS